jgi:hypothetical protein
MEGGDVVEPIPQLQENDFLLHMYLHRSITIWSNPMPEIIDPVFAKTSQNARFLLSENERLGLFS